MNLDGTWLFWRVYIKQPFLFHSNQVPLYYVLWWCIMCSNQHMCQRHSLKSGDVRTPSINTVHVGETWHLTTIVGLCLYTMAIFAQCSFITKTVSMGSRAGRDRMLHIHISWSAAGQAICLYLHGVAQPRSSFESMYHYIHNRFEHIHTTKYNEKKQWYYTYYTQ